jgi:RNA polymerase sigma-70 factor (ECF subfamily)
MTLAGDAEAFGLVYRQYRDWVYRIVYRRVGSPELAEDITQEVFVRAFRGIARWQWQGKDVGAWLATIAKNLVIDHHKSWHQRKVTAVADYPEAGVDPWEASPEALALAGIRNRDLLGALQHITADQAECLSNRFLRELSVAETAAVMGREENAIRSLTCRALQALKPFFCSGRER